MAAKAKTLQRGDSDNPWKHALDVYFQAFMEYCFPEIARNIDWSKGFEFLDKELQTISRGTKTGKRIADKLVKVWEKNGRETWILCHIEIQARREEKFPQRMFVYHYRIWDRYQKPVISIAILIDANLNWRPDVYKESHYGCTLELRYLVIKLLDYRNRRQELEEMNNPFTAIILSQLDILETRKNPKARFQAKTALTRRLFESNWLKKDIQQLHSLIDWLIALPKDLMVQYHQEVERIKGVEKMRYISTAERVGEIRGREQGIEQGIQQGESALLIRQLKHRFGDISSHYLQFIQQASAETLLAWGERIFDASKLEDVFI